MVSTLPSEPGPAVSLRERKKARTKAAIQREALALFRANGYESTTVEQVAQAAEVAVSTVFRYFPAKEDLVLSDDYDALLIDAFRSPPPGMRPVEAIRRGLRGVFADLTEDEATAMRERAMLALAVPALRAALIGQFADAIRLIAELVARQSGQPPGEFAVHAKAGAIIGVMMSAEFYWVEHPEADLFTLLDDSLALLEAGLSV